MSVVVSAGSRKLAGVEDVFLANRVFTGTKLVVARPQMKYVFMSVTKQNMLRYRKDTEHLYNCFMYSLVSLLSGIYPLPAMHSLLVTLYVVEYHV